MYALKSMNRTLAKSMYTRNPRVDGKQGMSIGSRDGPSVNVEISDTTHAAGILTVQFIERSMDIDHSCYRQGLDESVVNARPITFALSITHQLHSNKIS